MGILNKFKSKKIENFLNTEEKNLLSLYCKGDAIIYLGKKLEHKRDIFKGDYQSQVFLHFVNQNGLYADKKFDGRIMLGQPK
jgi:hypothetical protein